MKTNPQRPILMISTVGTSLLTNPPITSEVQEVIKNTANRKEEELSPENRRILDAHKEKVAALLKKDGQHDLDEWIKRSAEVNGILAYMRKIGSERPRSMDMHYLITTDTYQGRLTADLVKEFLRDFNCQVECYTPPKLSTDSIEDFRLGLSHLIKWCSENIPEYQDRGYNVVFNLTGGFKSVQGCLTAIGMIWADEIIHIFQESKELIIIPRLPLKLEELSDEEVVVLELMNKPGTQLPTDALGDLLDKVHSAYIEQIKVDGQEYVASNVWGKSVWLKQRKEKLGNCLFNWPRLEYSKEFKDSAKARQSDLKELNEALAQVSAHLLESKGDISGLMKGHSGLKFERLENQKEEVFTFRVSQGLRVSCERTGNGLRLRKFGIEPEINRNP
ncbi:MAG: putative CRISPR-associated protein [Armatimonadota bacterium]